MSLYLPRLLVGAIEQFFDEAKSRQRVGNGAMLQNFLWEEFSNPYLGVGEGDGDVMDLTTASLWDVVATDDWNGTITPTLHDRKFAPDDVTDFLRRAVKAGDEQKTILGIALGGVVRAEHLSAARKLREDRWKPIMRLLLACPVQWDARDEFYFRVLFKYVAAKDNVLGFLLLNRRGVMRLHHPSDEECDASRHYHMWRRLQGALAQHASDAAAVHAAAIATLNQRISLLQRIKACNVIAPLG